MNIPQVSMHRVSKALFTAQEYSEKVAPNMKTANAFSFMEKFRKSSFISLVSVFAAFNVICDLLMSTPLPYSGVWLSWIFMVTPISGILLGPYAGFLSSFIGVMVGHSMVFRGSWEFLFTLGAPIGAMISGFLFRGRWREVLICYLAMLGAYFATPIAWQLPLWGMWDVFHVQPYRVMNKEVSVSYGVDDFSVVGVEVFPAKRHIGGFGSHIDY